MLQAGTEKRRFSRTEKRALLKGLAIGAAIKGEGWRAPQGQSPGTHNHLLIAAQCSEGSIFGADDGVRFAYWRPDSGRLSSTLFSRASWTAGCLASRSEGRFGTQGVRDQIGVLTQAVARALDVHDDGVVEQAVQKGGGNDLVAKNFRPFAEATIRSQDHGASLITGIDQLKEKIAGSGADAEIADFVNDEQRGPAQIADTLPQPTFTISFGKRIKDIGKRREVDATTGANGLDAERGR